MSADKGQKWILQFCHSYYGPFMDCVRQYAVLFKNTEYKVCTVYLTGEPSDEVVKGSASDEVVFLNYRSKEVGGLKLAAIRDVKKLAAERNFAYCIAHRFKPIYIALLATSLPVIGVQHAFATYKTTSRQIFTSLFRKRLRLLGVSNAIRDDMRHYLPKFPAENIQTLYNRIDIAQVQHSQISREQAREKLGLPDNAWIVANVGRLHPDKDQTTLIKGFAQALERLPAGSLLVILGQGRLESSLKALVQELDITHSVRFVGQVPQARCYFKAFDLFALTSDHEPFGMVLLEAMAAGIPVISSDCGGAKEVVNNPEHLFPLGSASELAELIVRMSQDGTCPEYDLEPFSDQAAVDRFFELEKVFLTKYHE